jgi:aryl-alcohol dehydrogenase
MIETITARAAVVHAPGEPFSIEDVTLGELQGDEILVDVKGVGICHTDLSAAAGVVPIPFPTVLGHEGSGVVAAVGPDVTNLEVGDHVAISFNHCRECDVCTGATPAYCESFAPLNYMGSRLDGSLTLHQGEQPIHGNWFGQSSFATRVIANQRNAVKVPTDLPIELLGPFGCGLQTGAASVLNVLKPKPGDSIAIFGLGGVGLSAVMAAKAAECGEIIAIDLNPARLELARELGATHTVNPSDTGDVVAAVTEIAPLGVNHSFDAVGIGPVIDQAIKVLRSPGHCVTVGFQGLEHDITIDQGHLLLGRRLTGVIEGDADPQEWVPRLIELYRAGKFPFDKLIQTFPFEKINEAVEASEKGTVIKPVLVFD